MEKGLKFLLWTVGILVALGGLGRLLLFETWTVPNDPYLAASVAPTLSGGDLVLVLTVGESVFGNLVRCPDPDDNTRHVVGRIVGLAGDQVELKGQTLRINGARYDASDACTQPTFSVAHPDTGTKKEMRCGRIEMGGGWHYRGTGKHSPSSDAQKRVGEGNVYLLSDNRDMHEDSRDFGTLPKASCEQRIVFRLWGADGWLGSENRLEFIR